MKRHSDMADGPHSAVATTPVDALILAADRGPDDAVTAFTGAPCKALAPVGGIVMLDRVLAALQQSQRIESLYLAGPSRQVMATQPARMAQFARAGYHWFDSAESPSASATRVLERIPADRAVLLTTADHALLNARIVADFLDGALAQPVDVVVGLVRLPDVQARFPGMRRTATRLADGPFCGCNLFAFTTHEGRQLARFWRRVERERKKPWRVISGALGWRAVVRYLLGRLTLDQALGRLSRRLGVRVGAVILEHPEAAVDVDKPDDWRFAEAFLREREQIETAHVC